MNRADEIRIMLEKADRYVHSAEVLSREQDYDSAISRLYYVMFYAAEALLFAEGFTYSSHKAVISAFGQHFAKTNRLPAELHQWLREGFEKRQVSDYDFITQTSDATVSELLPKATAFLSQVRNLLERGGHLKQ